jgi:hypothetical protein
MKLANKIVIARPIKVVVNSARKGDQWGQIKDAASNKVLHTGRLPYIVRTARVRYNHQVTLA